MVDLDGTLLHDAPTFEERSLSPYSIEVMCRLHDAGVRIAISTARPVSTGLPLVRKLPVDACSYLNGALIDFDPSHSDFASLTDSGTARAETTVTVGFPSRRACEVCLYLLEAMGDLRIGIVMDDVRYTNFDVRQYWKTQRFRLTDFKDVPDGMADKIIVFPRADQEEALRALVPRDLAVNVSEGVMWMLMNPQANKEQALLTMCGRWGIAVESAVSFGDDLIDIPMLRRSGLGVAVANARPEVLRIADALCPCNNDDGVAQWVERTLLSAV